MSSNLSHPARDTSGFVFSCGESTVRQIYRLHKAAPSTGHRQGRTILGLTGGIGAGKSLVSRTLATLGATIVDADLIAHRLTSPKQPLVRKLVEMFGTEIASGGVLDRKALAKIVFSDSQKKAQLESLMHPAIRAQIITELDASTTEITVVDAPLLIETGLWENTDCICVVTTTESLRITRLLQRGMTLQDAKARIASQITDTQRLQYADWQLINDGDITDTQECVRALYAVLD